MNYRNPDLLRLAAKAPFCMFCHKSNRGDVVAAHSNQLRDGKGTGIKAHDYRIAYLCGECHHEIDNGSSLDRIERIRMFEIAYRESVGWLFESGWLIIK